MSPIPLGVVASSNVLGGGISPLTVLETKQTTLGATGPQSLTFATTPVAGDKVIVAYACHRTTSIRVLSSITGMGGTWVGKYQPAAAVSLWIGNGVNAAGTITLTQNSPAQMTARAWLVRGLTSDTVSGTGYFTGATDGLPHSLGLPAGRGQMAVHWGMGFDASLGPISEPEPTSPPSGWTIHPSVSDTTCFFGASYKLATQFPAVTHSTTWLDTAIGDGMHVGACTVGTAA